MRRVARMALTFAISAMVLVSLLSGCGTKGPTYVDQGASYDKVKALAILAQVDGSAVADKPSSEGGKLRHSALAALRRQGATASGVADLVTRTFPSTASGVPLYVERATFQGKPSVVLVEAIGPAAGSLGGKRIWIIDEQGDVLFSGSR